MKQFSAVGLAATFAALALTSATLGAQAPAPAAAPPATDYSKVEIKTTKFGDNFYMLEGSGGTMGAQVGPDGILMVDSEYAPLTEKIVAAIKAVSNQPIRFMINTHLHPDHTGGDENFAKMGVTILTRDELRAGLLKNPATKPGTLATITYSGPITFHMNGEDIRAIPVPAAHTNGDTMVFFPKNDVLMTGDFFRSLGYPFMDLGNGGSVKGLLAGLDAVIQLAGPNTKIIPGHGVVVDKTAIAAHRDMVIAVRDRIDALMKQGKTLPEIVAAKPTADYDAKVPSGDTTSARFIGNVYNDLGGK